jgi:uncharacterized protein YkwD
MRIRAVGLFFLGTVSLMGTADSAPFAGRDAAIAGPSYPALPAQVAPGPRAQPWPANAFERRAEALIAAGINDQRARYAAGAPSIATNPILTEIAEQRSRDMAAGAAFSHTDDQGRFIAADLVRAQMGSYGAIGENIMMQGGSRNLDAAAFARTAVEGWMQSPGHRRNILDPDYDSSGIGVAVAGDRIYATQVFWGPAKAD